MSKKPITKAGFERLTKELLHLKETERPQIATAVAEARALGDLSENAEYHAAREKQRSIEGRISFLEELRQVCDIIDVSNIADKTTVRFGATVMLIDLETDNSRKIKIVSEYEANPSDGLISLETPIAKAVIGKRVGDICPIILAERVTELEINEISYDL